MTAPAMKHDTRHSCGEYKPARRKNPAVSDSAEMSGRWFADLLWRAFPSRSEQELAEKAARALDVSPRQVRNWMRQENSPAWKYVWAASMIAGVEFVSKRIEGDD